MTPMNVIHYRYVLSKCRIEDSRKNPFRNDAMHPPPQVLFDFE